ncbi:hypothetical protein [Rhodococcus qingshengii]|uniref:hypothetical protein n=1 Tax=Rhodococcus qingshengii TaxID=334542 RepID=UPI001C8CD908|nr:hypothetical protein [Rhodococcus qingshengii]MBX9150063.1 hypothetical protein [Rhodococcus qingshengii]
MTNALKRLTIAGALTATATLALAGTAGAATPPTVSITTGINSAKVTIAAPQTDVPASCGGPWVYTEAVAKLIRQSPTLDITNHPENWLKGDPVSPVGGVTGSQQAAWVYVNPGETKTADIAFIEDGNYVAGSFCMEVEDGQFTYALTQTPFTVGNPVTQPEPGGTGSLSFGS